MPDRTRLRAEFFRVIGHSLRIDIIVALKDGEKTVTELADELSVIPNTVSQQLVPLRTRGLIRVRREKTHAYYSVTDPSIHALLDLAARIIEKRGRDGGRL